MDKFIYHNNVHQKLHWLSCEKNKFPYIEVSNHKKGYSKICFDVTNYDCDLELISASIKKIYESYLSFFLIPFHDVEEIYDQVYFFSLVVKAEHAEFIAQALFDYLTEQI